MLKNVFNKKFLLAFLNSFVKIEENRFNLNTCSFQIKMLSNLTCVLIYSLTKCVLEDGLIFKRLGGSPCGFSKKVSSVQSMKPWFFVTFNIIISHIFPENFIEIPQVVKKI